jgi:transcriptional regulator with XRE-family HTH domain
MTPDEYREAIKRLGLSQPKAAALLGVHSVTSRRWASDSREIPPTVERFLRLVIALRLTPAQVEDWIASVDLTPATGDPERF